MCIFKVNMLGMIYFVSPIGIKTPKWNCLKAGYRESGGFIYISDLYKLMLIQHGNIMIKRDVVRLNSKVVVSVTPLSSERSGE